MHVEEPYTATTTWPLTSLITVTVAGCPPSTSCVNVVVGHSNSSPVGKNLTHVNILSGLEGYSLHEKYFYGFSFCQSSHDSQPNFKAKQ